MTKKQKQIVEAAVQAGLEQGYSLRRYGTLNPDGNMPQGSDDSYGCCLLGLLAHTMGGETEERRLVGAGIDALMAIGVGGWSDLEAGFEGWSGSENETVQFGAELARRYT